MQHPTNRPSFMLRPAARPSTRGRRTTCSTRRSAHLRWVGGRGIAPPSAPRVQTTTRGFVRTRRRRARQHARRHPHTHDRARPSPHYRQSAPHLVVLLFLFGTTVAFTPEQIAALLLRPPRAFVAAWTRATNSARRAGFLGYTDAKELLKRGEAVQRRTLTHGVR